MSKLRNILNSGLNFSTSFLPFSLLSSLAQQKLIFPFYHAVSDVELPHIKNLYRPKSIKEFTKDLDFLLKYYEAIDYNEFKDIVSEKKQLTKPCFLLSFDDGLKEFDEVIAPILLKKGVPAICFLNSGFVDNKDLFFRYKASLILEKILHNKALETKLNSFFNNSNTIRENILSIQFKNKKLLDEIATIVEIDFSAFLNEQKPYLETNQIYTLIKKGFHFGAHSQNHPEYQYISEAQQIEQTKKSIEYVCNNFNIDYRLFSFPFTDFGVKNSFFNYLYSEKIIDFSFGTAGQKIDTVKNHFQRIPFEKQNLSAKNILKNEFLYYLLKKPFNRNIIQRD